jgi:hypothetical protein
MECCGVCVCLVNSTMYLQVKPIMCTSCLDILKLYIFPTPCMYAFRKLVTTNSHYFHYSINRFIFELQTRFSAEARIEPQRAHTGFPLYEAAKTAN